MLLAFIFSPSLVTKFQEWRHAWMLERQTWWKPGEIVCWRKQIRHERMRQETVQASICDYHGQPTLCLLLLQFWHRNDLRHPRTWGVWGCWLARRGDELARYRKKQCSFSFGIGFPPSTSSYHCRLEPQRTTQLWRMGEIILTRISATQCPAFPQAQRKPLRLPWHRWAWSNDDLRDFSPRWDV